MVVKGPTEKVTYGQKHKAGEKMSHVEIWVRVFQGCEHGDHSYLKYSKGCSGFSSDYIDLPPFTKDNEEAKGLKWTREGTVVGKVCWEVTWIKECCEDFSFSVSEMEATEGCWVTVWPGHTCVCKGEFWSLVENLCMDESNRWELSWEVIPAWRMVPAVELKGGHRHADQSHVVWVRKAPRMTPIDPVLSNDYWGFALLGLCWYRYTFYTLCF